jgi:hypothetical protein
VTILRPIRHPPDFLFFRDLQPFNLLIE